MDTGTKDSKIKAVITSIKGKIAFNKSKLLIPLASLVLAVSAVTGVVGIANADTGTTTSTTTNPGGPMQRGTPPAAVGKVTAVNGNDITLTDTKSNETYTVDATNATITKRTAPTAQTTTSGTNTRGTRSTPTTITVSEVAVGDTLSVQGTVSGSTITATKIQDGVGGFGGGRGGNGGGMGVMGTVTAVNGNTVTVTGKNGTTYTVDASSATVSKMETMNVSDITVGDEIGVQGTVSGDSVTAKSIMDGMPKPEDTTSGSSTSS
jgi:hypothetical protein